MLLYYKRTSVKRANSSTFISNESNFLFMTFNVYLGLTYMNTYT